MNDVKCAFCKSSAHSSDFDKCPEKERQNNIKRLMAKRTVTYAEAREQIPATSNMYESLANLEGFPTLLDTFSTTVGRSAASTFRQQWAQTNQERTRITPAVKQFTEKDNKNTKAGTKRQRTDKNKEERINNDSFTILNSGENGTALENPFTVSERERWENITREEKRKAEIAASLNMKTTMMSFYTDFLDQLKDSDEMKRKFKTCTEKYFELAHTIENTSK